MEKIKGIILQPISEEKEVWSGYNKNTDDFLIYFQNIMINNIGENFNVNHNTEDLSGYFLIPYTTKQYKCFGAYYLKGGKKLSNNPQFEWAYIIDYSKSYNFVKEISQRELIEEAKNFHPEFEKKNENNERSFHYRLDILSKEYKEYIENIFLNTNSYPEGIDKPYKSQKLITDIYRDSKVKEWVLNNTNGYCECCDQKAPFIKDDDTLYLEIHHLKMLADNGSDKVTNAIAVCPNCHRELHFGVNKNKLLSKLYSKIPRLLRER